MFKKWKDKMNESLTGANPQKENQATKPNSWESHPSWGKTEPYTYTVVKKFRENICPCCKNKLRFIEGHKWYFDRHHKEQMKLDKMRMVQDFFVCDNCKWESAKKISEPSVYLDCGWQSLLNVGFKKRQATMITSYGQRKTEVREYQKEELISSEEYKREKW
jgi:hypothetical protein